MDGKHRSKVNGETALEADSLLLQTLTNLNQIGATINRIGSDGTPDVEATLSRIVESAIQVLPGAAAIIYTYDETVAAFDPTSRVSAGIWDHPGSNDTPRLDGLGQRAIAQRRHVLSYEETDLTIHAARLEAGAQVLGCFPLIVAEQAVGVLYVCRREAQPFSQVELLMLDNFINQAAIAIYHVHHLNRMQRNLARKEEEIRHLRRAGQLISSRLRLEETLETILQMALEVTNARYGIFRLLDKNGQLITGTVAGEYLTRPRVEALPLDATSVMGWVACHQQPVRIPDLRLEPWCRIYYPLDADMEMRSELAVPLINASGRLEGVLNLESPEIGAFSDDDEHLLQALAAQAVTAIQEVRLLDALQEMAEWLLTQSCHQVLERLVTQSCHLLNAVDSAIWLIQGDDLLLEVSSGGYQHEDYLPVKHSLIGAAILSQKPVIADDVCTDPRFNRPDLGDTQGWKSALIVPIIVGPDRELLGAFSVYSADAAAGRFAESEWATKVLTCLGHYAALALQNSARQKALQRAQERRVAAETFAVMGDIASNLLHHINNKVGAIPVRIQGIQAKCQPALEADAYLAHNLHKIEQCATEALGNVRENLAHLRPVQPDLVQIANCIKAVLQTVRLPPGIQVYCQDLDALPMVVASQSSVTLVFGNLLGNAAEAMTGQGLITIRGASGPLWVEIWVQDDGPGIPLDIQERIFEPNFSSQTNARPGKLGFGLWWVKTLMTRLGGTVTVASDGNHGTTFHLCLPRAEQRI